jgi:predicted methyltransferase
MTNLISLAHSKIKEVVHSGDLCIDATAGNGQDTLILAQSVAPSGKVYAIDIQKCAIMNTCERLKKHGLSNLLQAFHGSHSDIESFLSNDLKAMFTAAMFNLGYLPRGNQEIITQPQTTLSAICKIFEYIKPGGLISVLCYRGHEGGKKETQEVLNLCQKENWTSEVVEGNNAEHSPILILIRKTKRD